MVIDPTEMVFRIGPRQGGTQWLPWVSAIGAFLTPVGLFWFARKFEREAKAHEHTTAAAGLLLNIATLFRGARPAERAVAMHFLDLLAQNLRLKIPEGFMLGIRSIAEEPVEAAYWGEDSNSAKIEAYASSLCATYHSRDGVVLTWVCTDQGVIRSPARAIGHSDGPVLIYANDGIREIVEVCSPVRHRRQDGCIERECSSIKPLATSMGSPSVAVPGLAIYYRRMSKSTGRDGVVTIGLASLEVVVGADGTVKLDGDQAFIEENSRLVLGGIVVAVNDSRVYGQLIPEAGGLVCRRI